MGYACPVCDTPQADGEHLANHLAFTAMLRGGDHETWLDEHIPGWGELAPSALASEVVEHAEETDHETVFEDTSDGHAHVQPGPGDIAPADLDAEARAILEEARAMTRERRSHDEERKEE